MPIKAENKARYPQDWLKISRRIRDERAQCRCECAGECRLSHGGRCEEQHLMDAITFKGRVILTVAHLDHTPENCADDNLRAFCQACHLRYDAKHHADNARKTREAKKAERQPTLF